MALMGNEAEIKMRLRNYMAILLNKKRAKFLDTSLKSLKQRARRLASNCELCERKCNVNRIRGEVGFCGAPNKLLISSEFLHYGEEYFFVPSHTVFFMGCNFRCVYCQNWPISQWYEAGFEISPKELALIVRERKKQGAKNLNLVGGEPTPYLPWIIDLLIEMKKLDINTPIIWNSNFYMSEKAMKILTKIVDVWLPDFKYGNNECAMKLSSAPNYVEVVTRNLKIASRTGELVIRHLILPGHVECCSFRVLRWIASNVREKAIVNLMDQYRPDYLVPRREELASLARRITRKEFESVVSLARKLDICFIT